MVPSWAVTWVFIADLAPDVPIYALWPYDLSALDDAKIEQLRQQAIDSILNGSILELKQKSARKTNQQTATALDILLYSNAQKIDLPQNCVRAPPQALLDQALRKPVRVERPKFGEIVAKNLSSQQSFKRPAKKIISCEELRDNAMSCQEKVRLEKAKQLAKDSLAASKSLTSANEPDDLFTRLTFDDAPLDWMVEEQDNNYDEADRLAAIAILDKSAVTTATSGKTHESVADFFQAEISQEEQHDSQNEYFW